MEGVYIPYIEVTVTSAFIDMYIRYLEFYVFHFNIFHSKKNDAPQSQPSKRVFSIKKGNFKSTTNN